jgi:hypothetical protein
VSPAGDRIALGLERTNYTFATDGSDFTQIAGGDTTSNRLNRARLGTLESGRVGEDVSAAQP